MIASLATIEGREKQADRVYASLRPQARTFLWRGPIKGRTDDSRKFAVDWKLEKYSGYILTCDDDLVYPPDYVAHMVSECEKHGCPVSLMGRVLTHATGSYYRDKGARIKYDWRNADGHTEQVHVPGTGVLCYHTDHVRFKVEDFPHPNMADIHFGVKCKTEGVRIMRVPPPRRDWLTYLDVPDTIYDRHHDDDAVQTRLVNQTWFKG